VSTEQTENTDLETSAPIRGRRPSPATQKRLYAVSRNRCAFPGCPNPLYVDGKLCSEVCHIKAARAGGPRWDGQQSEEERHGFENLVVMCSNHSDLIDRDVATYTVETLIGMKKNHETQAESQSLTPDPHTALIATTKRDIRRMARQSLGQNPSHVAIIALEGALDLEAAESLEDDGHGTVVYVNNEWQFWARLPDIWGSGNHDGGIFGGSRGGA